MAICLVNQANHRWLAWLALHGYQPRVLNKGSLISVGCEHLVTYGVFQPSSHSLQLRFADSLASAACNVLSRDTHGVSSCVEGYAFAPAALNFMKLTLFSVCMLHLQFIGAGLVVLWPCPAKG